MTRGLGTLFYKRHLLNPLRFGGFAVRLGMHKLIRWLVPWAAVLGVAGVVLAAAGGAAWARAALVLGIVAAIVAAGAWFWPEKRPLPRWLGLPAFAFWGVTAGLHAWVNALRGELHPTWEPTRRA